MKESMNLKKYIKNKVRNAVKNIVKNEVAETMEYMLPSLIEFMNSSEENKLSFYDHTKNPAQNISYYEDLRNDLINQGIKVEEKTIEIADFLNWQKLFPDIVKQYKSLGDVSIEKCLEHYITYNYLNISKKDVYIDMASSGSPWANILNKQKGVKSYRLDLCYPKGIKGINIGADAGNTKLPEGFASVLSLQCAYECFMGDADTEFVNEANRILNEGGRYGIVPLYIDDEYFISTSPFCDQNKIQFDPEARKVWRDDQFKVPFSRHYSPKSFFKRIYSIIPDDMSGKIIYFNNLDEIMKYYPGQRLYCFFMFICEKNG